MINAVKIVIIVIAMNAGKTTLEKWRGHWTECAS